MSKEKMRKYGAGAAVLGAVAGAAALALPAASPQEEKSTTAWRPATYGLTTAPERLLPAVVSDARPVRVVTTVRGPDGRPAVSMRTATDRDAASALVSQGQRTPGAIGVELDVPVTVAEADPLSGAQWDLGRIRVGEAWAHSTGAGITVAVVDSGVDASHPDLAGQILPGADFITGREGTSVDPHGHGTHVAGTIAALTGNGVGVAGMAPDARILPVRVLGENGAGYMSDVAAAIAYATDHGADVINLSISATTQVGAVSNAVAYARSQGVVVVAAAGNARRSGSPTSFPAADEGVIAVAATDSVDAVATYSSQGSYVDVAAPGSDIISSYPVARYGRMSGTSMASPHVAALAALLKGYDRGFTPDRIEQMIEDGATDLGTPGRDDDFGAGLIDAEATLTQAKQENPATGELTPSPELPAATAPAPTPTAKPTSESTEEPSQEPTTAPTTPAATTSAPVPAPTTPARQPVTVYLARTGPSQLTVAIRGAEGQAAEVQRETGDGWLSVHTYPATTVVRLNDLTRGLTYRVVVADSAQYLGATSTSVRL